MEDIRSQFGIYDISRECYEMLDGYIAKVIKVSSINVTALPKVTKGKYIKALKLLITNQISVCFQSKQQLKQHQ